MSGICCMFIFLCCCCLLCRLIMFCTLVTIIASRFFPIVYMLFYVLVNYCLFPMYVTILVSRLKRVEKKRCLTIIRCFMTWKLAYQRHYFYLIIWFYWILLTYFMSFLTHLFLKKSLALLDELVILVCSEFLIIFLEKNHVVAGFRKISSFNKQCWPMIVTGW